MLQLQLENIRHLDRQIETLDGEVATRLNPVAPQLMQLVYFLSEKLTTP